MIKINNTGKYVLIIVFNRKEFISIVVKMIKVIKNQNNVN